MPSLADIRARLAAQTQRNDRNNSSGGDQTLYRHWDIPENTSANLRFLPDANPKNDFFWVERQLIKLPFNGVIGYPEMKRVEVQVPCIEAWDGPNTCPVHNELRTWYKDESLKELANKYWKKRSYIFQGFVRTNPLADDKTPENPIRRFLINSQIFGVIKNGLTDPEVVGEDWPYDYNNGLDFIIKKTTKPGGYADYTTSNYARKNTPLTEAERAAIEQYGLFNLTDFAPKKPGEAEIAVILEMFNASVDGKPYDPERWGNFYKPWGLRAGGSEGTAPSTGDDAPAAQAPVRAPAAAPSTPPWEDEEPAAAPRPIVKPTAPAVSSEKAADLLAMIRARQANKVA